MILSRSFRRILSPAIPIILTLVFAFHHGSAAERQSVSLNGTWAFQWDNDRRLQYPPEESRWSTVEVTKINASETGYGKDGANHWAWYRRDVRVPDAMRGQRISIRFASVKFTAIVYWNGEKIGEHRDGYIPFEMDVTERVRFDRPNELLVGVISGIGFQRGDVLPYTERDFGETGENENRPPYGSLIGPVYKTEMVLGGICDDVELVSRPDVQIDDFHITTSVRQSEIATDVTVLNKRTKSVQCEAAVSIEDKGTVIREFPRQPVRLAPDGTHMVQFRARWADPHLWSHEDPYLYTLVMRIYEGNTVTDTRTFRFGFREYWIEGANFLLNGTVFRIRRNYFNYGSTYDDAKRFMTELKAININQIRLHHSGAPEWICSMADEMGMTLCPESTFYSRTRWYDFENPEMWDNARIHWAGIVKSAKNHPSVVMYSLENEMHSTGSYMAEADPDKWRRYMNQWEEIGRFVKNLDPTKPLQYSWGNDVGGWCETVNIHYPRAMRDFFQYPNDLYWLEHENLTEHPAYGYGGSWSRSYQWKKDKPLIIGEFAWSRHSNPPHGLSAFIGEDAYVGSRWRDAWHWAAKNENDAYRYSGVTANPWIYDESRPGLFPPIEVFVKNWQANYYGGEVMRKETVVLNDVFQPSDLLLTAEIISGDSATVTQTHTLQLMPGEKWERTLSFPLPEVNARTNAVLKLKLDKDHLEVYAAEYPVYLFPAISPPVYDANTVALYDTHGKTRRALVAGGFPFRELRVLTPESLDGLRILIIGKDSIDPPFTEPGKHINAFVHRGGRVICMEQTRIDTYGWLPLRLYIDAAHASTIAFKSMPDHPILEQIEEDDLKYWRGTHRVSTHNFRRPNFWNYSTIAWVGGGDGMDHTPLVTLPHGAGLFIFSQFVISEQLPNDPAACQLFGNMLKYALAYHPVASKAAVLASAGSSLKRVLTLFGTRMQHLQTTLPADLKTFDVLFTDGSVDIGPFAETLKRYVNDGGTIVLRELSPETISNVRAILPGDFKLESAPATLHSRQTPRERGTASAQLHKREYHPLLAGISNFDLYRSNEESPSSRENSRIIAYVPVLPATSMMIPLTEPAAIAVLPSGKGKIIIDQIHWEEGLKSADDKTCRIISNFLNNLHITMLPNISLNTE